MDKIKEIGIKPLALAMAVLALLAGVLGVAGIGVGAIICGVLAAVVAVLVLLVFGDGNMGSAGKSDKYKKLFMNLPIGFAQARIVNDPVNGTNYEIVDANEIFGEYFKLDVSDYKDKILKESKIEYTETQPFHLYYLTVSGHVPYGYGAANAMADKNKAVVSDLNYVLDTTKAYLASQYEMEKMLEYMMKRLEKKGLLDNTVIVLAGDHVPYDNMDVVDELAGENFGNSLEAYRSRLVIWSASMEKPVRVDKVCSSIDILPTMLNLMGVDYDSRLIIGRDILSDSTGLVLFPDRSFITDAFEYNAVTDTLTSHTGAEVSDDSFIAMQLYVADKFTAADNITESGYYTYVARYLGIDEDN